MEIRGWTEAVGLVRIKPCSGKVSGTEVLGCSEGTGGGCVCPDLVRNSSLGDRAGKKWGMMLKQEQPVRRWALRLDVRTESKTHIKAGELT